MKFILLNQVLNRSEDQGDKRNGHCKNYLNTNDYQNSTRGEHYLELTSEPEIGVQGRVAAARAPAPTTTDCL
jgi:hypothetical protein